VNGMRLDNTGLIVSHKTKTVLDHPDGSVILPKLATDIFQNLNPAQLLKGGDFASWSAGTSSAPDGFKLLGTSATISQQPSPSGLGYVASVTNGDTYYALLRQTITPGLVKGKTVTLITSVKASDADRVRIAIQDNDGTNVETSYSSYHSGGGGYETLIVTKTIQNDATTVYAWPLLIGSGSVITADIDWAMLVIGELPVSFASHPNDQHLKAVDYQDNGTNYEYGLIAEQNGIAQIDDTASTKAITFPKEFTKLLSIQITPIDSEEVIRAVSGSTTGFTATRSGTAGNNQFYWSAKGVL